MRDVTGQNFGYLVAYILPGLLALLAVDQVWPGMQPWLEGAALPTAPPTVAGFLYVTLVSVGAGVTVSTVRWLIVDWLHHHTGITPPRWDDSKLQDKLGAFEALVDAHYRYYQFYANSLVCLSVMLGIRASSGVLDAPGVVLALLCWLFWVGSRDTLRRYYRRTEQLLGALAQGVGHDERASSKEQQRPRSTIPKSAATEFRAGARLDERRRKRAGTHRHLAGRGHEL